MKQTLLKTAVKQIIDNFPTNFAELTNDTGRFLDPCSYAVLFSDFLFGITHDENIMQMLYEKYESSFEDVSVELYCDTENCRQFLQTLGDLAAEAAEFDENNEVKVQEIHFDGDEYPDSVYVITVTGTWDVSVEKFTERVPNPSAEFIIWADRDKRRYFIDEDYLGVFEDLF